MSTELTELAHLTPIGGPPRERVLFAAGQAVGARPWRRATLVVSVVALGLGLTLILQPPTHEVRVIVERVEIPVRVEVPVPIEVPAVPISPRELDVVAHPSVDASAWRQRNLVLTHGVEWLPPLPPAPPALQIPEMEP